MKRLNINKICFVVLLLLISRQQVFSQAETVIPPSNRSTVDLEKNLLFYADRRYTVTQSGSTSLPLAGLFDGNYQPNYSGAIDSNNPYIITIGNLPNYHVQAGAWIGWTTRYYSPVKFKIEVLDGYPYNSTYNTWITVADVDNNHNGSYIVALPQCVPGSVRFTFYQGEGPGGAIGISELFLIHPEATQVYDGIMVQYDHGGNVGIGTPTPLGVLDVRGQGVFANPDFTTTTGTGLLITRPVSSGNTYTTLNSYTNGVTAVGDIAFQTNGGNVGIGTPTPGAKLDIINSVNGSISLQAGANNFGQALYYAADTRPGNTNTPRVVMHLSAEGTNSYAYGQRWYLKEGKTDLPQSGANDKGTNQLIFNTASAADGFATSTDVLTCLGNGNVGIGTTSPSSILDLQQVTPTITLSPASYAGLYRTTLGTTAGAQAFLILGNNGQNEIRAGNTNPGGYLDFFTNNTVSQGAASNGNLVMRMAANGNVGIGTIDPHGYKLAVNGNMIATSVKVQAYADWPDYVFEKGQTLMPLTDLKTYVDKNKHLPGIPSAAEVEKDGQDLGEMNKILVKKVEELTLYLIEKDKQIKDQEQRLKDLEQIVKKITRKDQL